MKKEISEESFDKMLVSKQLNDNAITKTDTFKNGESNETTNGITYIDDKDALDWLVTKKIDFEHETVKAICIN